VNTKNLIILAIAAVLVVFGIIFIGSKQNPDSIKITDNRVTGIVSTSTDGKMLYANKDLGMRFNYPIGWHLGENTLGDSSGHGYLQLYNYDETQVSGGSVFEQGTNKIEIVLVDNSEMATSSDYVEQDRKTAQVEIAGKSSIRYDITLLGNQKYRTYIIPYKDKFLSMTIYGDSRNFSVLDQVVQSLSFE
jgi:hypothetical protein